MSGSAPPLPLGNVRVADFSWFAAGPVAGRTLASFGADVVRIESEARLDGLRLAQPVPPGAVGPNVSGYYNNYNAGKRSLTLNLARPGARAVALRLLATCDVMLENFTPRVTAQWGLTYEDVAAVRPDIIYLRMPMQGSDGPHRDFLGFGGIIAPLAGFTYLAGWPDRAPTGMGVNYPDYVINPGHAVVAILAALRHRNRTGEGQLIELSQLESTAATIGPALMEQTVNGRTPERAGNRHPVAAPHGIFRCRPEKGVGTEAWIAIAVSNDGQWERLLDLMGRPAWALQERFATFLGRKRHEDELERGVEAWTGSLAAPEAMRLLQAAGVPAGVVQSARDVLENDEHLRARGYFAYLDHPETGRSAHDGLSIRLSATPGRLATPAPLIGQHSHELLTDLLGYDDGAVADFIVDQVVY